MHGGRTVGEDETARSRRENRKTDQKSHQGDPLDGRQKIPAEPQQKNPGGDGGDPMDEQKGRRGRAEQPGDSGKEPGRQWAVLQIDVAVVPLPMRQAVAERPPDPHVARWIEPPAFGAESCGGRDRQKQDFGKPEQNTRRCPSRRLFGQAWIHTGRGRSRATSRRELPNGSESGPRALCSNRDRR